MKWLDRITCIIITLSILYLILQLGRYWGFRESMKTIPQHSKCYSCHQISIYESEDIAKAAYEALKMAGFNVRWEVKE